MSEKQGDSYNIDKIMLEHMVITIKMVKSMKKAYDRRYYENK